VAERELLHVTAQVFGADVHTGAVIITREGPRLSHAAEKLAQALRVGDLEVVHGYMPD
jgi:hypothetical protein